MAGVAAEQVGLAEGRGSPVRCTGTRYRHTERLSRSKSCREVSRLSQGPRGGVSLGNALTGDWSGRRSVWSTLSGQ